MILYLVALVLTFYLALIISVIVAYTIVYGWVFIKKVVGGESTKVI